MMFNLFDNSIHNISTGLEILLSKPIATTRKLFKWYYSLFTLNNISMNAWSAGQILAIVFTNCQTASASKYLEHLLKLNVTFIFRSQYLCSVVSSVNIKVAPGVRFHILY